MEKILKMLEEEGNYKIINDGQPVSTSFHEIDDDPKYNQYNSDSKLKFFLDGLNSGIGKIKTQITEKSNNIRQTIETLRNSEAAITRGLNQCTQLQKECSLYAPHLIWSNIQELIISTMDGVRKLKKEKNFLDTVQFDEEGRLRSGLSVFNDFYYFLYKQNEDTQIKTKQQLDDYLQTAVAIRVSKKKKFK